MRHTISVLVRNEFGVLSRVAGMFSGRGYNIDSLNVAPTLDPKVSNMTIVTEGDDETIEQITKQLHKLIDVMKVTDHLEGSFVDREMAVMKVAPTAEQRAEVLRVVEIFRGRIVDVGAKSFVVEVTGRRDKIAAMAKLLEPLGLREIVRTGPLAMARG
ncbi:MAG TPA: acetolactate synthase small subunit [Myxococcota bacterium]|jgi:acetolactate synthase-1/3 small subunit|nr:acetolactate synthase small subunit [Myxococcota bacterium]